MQKLISRLMKEEDGQGMAEYGLILALVAIVVIGALTLLGGNLNGILSNVANTLGGGSSSSTTP